MHTGVDKTIAQFKLTLPIRKIAREKKRRQIVVRVRGFKNVNSMVSMERHENWPVSLLKIPRIISIIFFSPVKQQNCFAHIQKLSASTRTQMACWETYLSKHTGMCLVSIWIFRKQNIVIACVRFSCNQNSTPNFEKSHNNTPDSNTRQILCSKFIFSVTKRISR